MSDLAVKQANSVAISDSAKELIRSGSRRTRSERMNWRCRDWTLGSPPLRSGGVS